MANNKGKMIFAVFLCLATAVSFAQQTDDFEVAHQYVVWIRQALEEGRLVDAMSAIERAQDFSNVNSDISFLAAFVFSKPLGAVWRSSIINYLDTAIEVNRWHFYSENEALLLKAEQLIDMQRYSSALSVLDLIREGDARRDATISLLPLSNDAAMLRLRAFRGLSYNAPGATEIAVFRTYALSTINRFSRDPRPAVIFLEYLQLKKRQNQRVRFEIDINDQQILDIIIRRLPLLVELEPNLAWMAAPFMQNESDAKRYVAGFRAGGFLEDASDFFPNPKSIPLALNYGLINDMQAVEELFFNQSTDVPFLAVDLEVLTDTYAMLRSEEGRDMFTHTLLNFSGSIYSDSDYNGISECIVSYRNGIIERLYSYKEDVDKIAINFDSNGMPDKAELPAVGYNLRAEIYWERYPFVKQVFLFEEPYIGWPCEDFSFRLADFSFAPVEFITIGGSRTRPGITYPVVKEQVDLTRRTLVSFCATIKRPSDEFNNAVELISLENGIPAQAVEILNDNLISITEFEGGIPVIQYIDLDLDGRMETIRRFHRPGQNFPWPEPDEKFDYRKLIADSESDWRGDGRYKTGEVYLPDGSVVYRLDMDGSGIMNYNE